MSQSEVSFQGLLRSISPQRGSTRFLPKGINLSGSSLGPFIGFIFPFPVNVGVVPIINRFLEKESPKLYCCPLFGDSTGPSIPSFSLATYSAFGNSVKMALYRAPGSLLGRNGARDLSWFYSDRFDPKKNIVRLYMNMILGGLEQRSKLFKSWVQNH